MFHVLDSHMYLVASAQGKTGYGTLLTLMSTNGPGCIQVKLYLQKQVTAGLVYGL